MTKTELSPPRMSQALEQGALVCLFQAEQDSAHRVYGPGRHADRTGKLKSNSSDAALQTNLVKKDG